MLCAFAFLLAPSSVLADEPSVAEWARAQVEDSVLRPLAERETSRFSRSLPPARERRVRVLPTTHDKNGRPFVSFAVDVRYGGKDWHRDDIVGCVYLGKGDLYVRRGDGYRPAAFLFGKKADVVRGACEAGPASGKTAGS